MTRQLRRLLRDTSGVAMLEFAWTMPVVLAIGCYGIEVANLAMLNLRISQIALNLADNASRVGVYNTLSTQQLREVDINDVLQAVRLQGNNIELSTRGRITLSSLEKVQRTYADGTSDATLTQRIHWQRCMGQKSGAGYDSSYGSTPITAGTDTAYGNRGTVAPTGMGDATRMVTAADDSAVMFVEVNYLTKPLFGTMLVSPTRLHYVASFIVRDRRDFQQIYNPVTSPVTPRATCDLHNA